LTGALASIGNPKLKVELQARHRRVAVGGDPGVSLTVTNLGTRRLTGRQLVVPIGQGNASIRLAGLAPAASMTADVTVPTKRRALLMVGPVQAVRGDPFGMVARTWSWGEALAVVVYPATVRVPVSITGLAKDIEGKPTGQPSEADVSFHALRDYQPGDDRRAIHWRSTARTGRLMVRQSEDTRRAQLALVVSQAGREYHQAADFELAVSVYASIGLAQLENSGELAVIAAGARLAVNQAGPGPLLDHAAAISLTSEPGVSHSLAGAAGLTRREAPSATVAVMVTGTVLERRELRRIAWFLPAEATALALRCQAGAELSVSQFGRLGLATIGSLEQLPRVLRGLGMQ
jgi:uncharacterized protein (DUF58 family)